MIQASAVMSFMLIFKTYSFNLCYVEAQLHGPELQPSLGCHREYAVQSFSSIDIILLFYAHFFHS